MMVFAWDDVNRDHVAKHDVSPDEAEHVVRSARPPFPRAVGDGKYMVWGRTTGGRYLQVIFVFKEVAEVKYESLSPEQWQTIEAGRIHRIVRVIHAMDLTDDMKRSLRRRRR